MKEENPSQETIDKWQKDPNNWKWGILYYNKEDKRVFPPKKIAEMGFTVNFANRNSVIAFIAFMLFALTIIYMITSKK